MVDVSRVLLERTATLGAARTYTSSVELWWERRDSYIYFDARGVDDEGWGRMDIRRASRLISCYSVVVIIIILSRQTTLHVMLSM